MIQPNIRMIICCFVFLAGLNSPAHASSSLGRIIKNDDGDLMQAYLDRGGHPNKTVKGRPLLVHACEKEKWNVFTALLNAPNIDVNKPGKRGRGFRPLAILLQKRKYDKVSMLVERGADLALPTSRYGGKQSIEELALKRKQSLKKIYLQWVEELGPDKFDYFQKKDKYLSKFFGYR